MVQHSVLPSHRGSGAGFFSALTTHWVRGAGDVQAQEPLAREGFSGGGGIHVGVLPAITQDLPPSPHQKRQMLRLRTTTKTFPGWRNSKHRCHSGRTQDVGLKGRKPRCW